jgi:hypothetical protein
MIDQAQLLPERDKLEAAKGALAAAEVEWKLLTGTGAGASGAAADPDRAATWFWQRLAAGAGREDETVALALRYLAAQQGAGDATALRQYMMAFELARERTAVKGLVADRLRAALDKPVKLGPKGAKFTYPQVLEVFKKEAGWDIPVRGHHPVPLPRLNKDGEQLRDERGAPLMTPVPEIVSDGEELPVGAWFQMLEDALSEFGNSPQRVRFYVREYGVLLSPISLAPPDAPTLHDFWKRKPAPEAKTEPKTGRQ